MSHQRRKQGGAPPSPETATTTRSRRQELWVRMHATPGPTRTVVDEAVQHHHRRPMAGGPTQTRPQAPNLCFNNAHVGGNDWCPPTVAGDRDDHHQVAPTSAAGPRARAPRINQNVAEAVQHHHHHRHRWAPFAVEVGLTPTNSLVMFSSRTRALAVSWAPTLTSSWRRH